MGIYLQKKLIFFKETDYIGLISGEIRCSAEPNRQPVQGKTRQHTVD